MSCTGDCNQGRACTCAPKPGAVSAIAALVWVVAVVALLAVLLGVAQ